MADFALSVTTPERQLVDEPASEATIPARNGYIGVLPGHAPLLSALSNGLLTWTSGGQSKTLAVLGGFVEVLGDRVRVLADSARRKEEIDPAQARARLESARQALAQPPQEHPAPEDWDKLLDEIRRAETEVEASNP